MKCALSDEPESTFSFDEAATAIVRPVSRSQFERWIEPEVSKIDRCVDHLLAKCNVAPKQVDAIFMTGGSSFVPAIRRLFERKFGTQIPIRADQEFTSVAEGLALYALKLADGSAEPTD